jgi:thiol-disulfide isomerase/thioredoxin
MRKFLVLVVGFLVIAGANAQTTLTEAVNFHVKTIYGEPIWLFPLLDDENKIVVVDFFSTTCGPCQDYAPDFQACYENFGYNEGNVYFMGINWGNDNEGVREFDSIFGLTFPSASGSQGGGNIVFGDFEILSYPTVIIITPDHNIVEQYIWYPSEENITNAVIAAGGTMVGTNEIGFDKTDIKVFPNPVNSFGTVEFNLKSTSDVYLTIHNLHGKNVYRSQAVNYNKGVTQISFSTDGFKNGYYIVKIMSENENIATKKFSILY